MSRYTFQYFEYAVVSLLRTTLGTIFVWLGLLKVVGYQPNVIGLQSVPYFGFTGSTVVFGIVESLIGILLLANVVWKLTEILLLIYLLGVLLIVIAIPDMLFANTFPRLTVVGELIIKNVAVGIAGVGVLVHEQRQSNEGM